MTKLFVIEDEKHAENQGEYPSFEAAVTELQKRMTIPWDQEPNRCPCEAWETCGRTYEIVEYDTDIQPWKELNRKAILNISATETSWLLK